MTKAMDKFEERIEQIEKFASQCYEDGEKYSAFIAGAIWADRNPVNVWHDASEEPTKKGYLLIQFGNAEYGTFRLRDIDVWCAWLMKNCYIIRWAYIKDLLPKGGKK